eukprot:GGOE01013928.1.p2 GENE.GGOE01013928.1~~GGOE01013928.1.p2  ORF type:complete len:221 (-),score=26.58 GGOE01013928.1:147-809(-)
MQTARAPRSKRFAASAFPETPLATTESPDGDTAASGVGNEDTGVTAEQRDPDEPAAKKPRATPPSVGGSGPNKPYMPLVDSETGEALIGALSADKIPGLGTTWNPSGLSESHLKKLSCGFYGWENEFLIKVTRTSDAFFHENQELPNQVAQRMWIEPQKEYVDEALRPDCNGIRWELKYLTRGCSCGWPYYLTRVPQLKVERRRCANYCCRREWEVHSTV